MKFKFNDKIKIVKDPDSDGFYLGAKGRVISYNKNVTENKYGIEIKDAICTLWCNEDEIEHDTGYEEGLERLKNALPNI